MRNVVLPLVAAVAAVSLLGACSLSAGSIEKKLEQRSECRISGFQITSGPKDGDGGEMYEFTCTVNCAGSRSFNAAKFPKAAKTRGKATVVASWLGLRKDIGRYQFYPAD